MQLFSRVVFLSAPAAAMALILFKSCGVGPGDASQTERAYIESGRRFGWGEAGLDRAPAWDPETPTVWVRRLTAVKPLDTKTRADRTLTDYTNNEYCLSLQFPGRQAQQQSQQQTLPPGASLPAGCADFVHLVDYFLETPAPKDTQKQAPRSKEMISYVTHWDFETQGDGKTVKVLALVERPLASASTVDIEGRGAKRFAALVGSATFADSNPGLARLDLASDGPQYLSRIGREFHGSGSWALHFAPVWMRRTVVRHLCKDSNQSAGQSPGQDPHQAAAGCIEIAPKEDLCADKSRPCQITADSAMAVSRKKDADLRTNDALKPVTDDNGDRAAFRLAAAESEGLLVMRSPSSTDATDCKTSFTVLTRTLDNRPGSQVCQAQLVETPAILRGSQDPTKKAHLECAVAVRFVGDSNTIRSTLAKTCQIVGTFWTTGETQRVEIQIP